MINVNTKVKIVDNSGAKIGQCIKIYGGSKVNVASIGDTILVAIKEVRSPDKVKKGDISKAIVVRINTNVTRSNGLTIRLYENAVILINNKGEPLGTRIFGLIPAELRYKKQIKILSLATNII
jgi:large subunit ribosomal protein L14